MVALAPKMTNTVENPSTKHTLNPSTNKRFAIGVPFGGASADEPAT